jgi:transposase
MLPDKYPIICRLQPAFDKLEFISKFVSMVGTKSNKELRMAYGVSKPTWYKWLERIPELNKIRSQKVFTPDQVQKIINHLGNP